MPNTIFFIGAGGSVPFGLPTMAEMVLGFEDWMKKSHSGLEYVVNEIKNKLSEYGHYDIEALITVLQDIINYEQTSKVLYNHPSLHFFTPVTSKTFISTVSDLGKRYHNEATQILKDLKNYIVESCTIKKFPYEIYKGLFQSLLKRGDYQYEEWIKNPNRPIGNEIFTTNYDRVLEAYCSNYDLQRETGEKQDKLDISMNNNILYGASVHCIYKLHGSVNWYIDGKGNMRASGEPVKIGTKTSLGHDVVNDLLVYPAYTKYTYREPFYTMFHYLKQRLSMCKVCCVVGYSFRDEDILGIFLDSMMINQSLKLVIVDPNAENIKKKIFLKYVDSIYSIPVVFDENAVMGIDRLIIK